MFNFNILVMKKIFMIAWMALLLPATNLNLCHVSCYANDDDKLSYPQVPISMQISPITFDFFEETLFIHNSMPTLTIYVEVTFENQTIFTDIITQGTELKQYDFDGYSEGTYHVVLYVGTTILDSYNFVIY